MTEPILTLEHISKSFAGIAVLKDIHLELYPGEVHGLVGENGAGKSTLIKIISGAYQPDRGTIVYRATRSRISTRTGRVRMVSTRFIKKLT